MTQRAGAVTGARVEEVLSVFLARGLPVPPERAALLNRWQAFSTLWRQQWHPAPREDRRLRWAVAIFSVLVNLFFAVALVWLMYLQFLGLEPPRQGETVVQIEFVGAGTPGEVGGGNAPQTPTDEPSDAQSNPSPEVAQGVQPPADAEGETGESPPDMPAVGIEARTSPPQLAGEPLDVPEREVAAPSIPAAPQEQAVAVSEPAPDTTEVFVLPPTRTVAAGPRLTPRELQANTPQVQEREVTAPVRANAPVIEANAPTARPLAARAPQVVERDVVAPVQAPTAREVEVRTPAVRDLAARPQAIREREVRAPVVPQPSSAPTSPATIPASTTARTAAPSAASQPASSAAAPSASATSSPKPATTAARSGTTTTRPPASSPSTEPGTGPKAQPAPGTWATPARADDWGASVRNTPGAQRGEAPGVFNADGSVRVPEGPGSAAPGMPPGAVTQEIANLDRAGTWLKRKPTDFEPTSFDKYWVPNETLLAEWVRKSIKEVLIPIPGTNKRIRCAVALLALGGACAITDPNLNEQPATARPPPPVPFKPHLQEDNGSIKPGTPPGG
ncbi:hypothetical protein [Aerolutibacter daejeonensis]|uniref:hypothetical protein n=1 Tax=Aerolutibacter daejeonensis TaxID=346181 RepID=UPI000A3F3E45|nr:hypothetical protein [Lysobacter daejeonensis]